MVAAWQGFIPFIVDAIATESEGVRSFSFRPADGRDLPPFVAGQHIVLRIPLAGKEDSVQPVRMYSLCGPENKKEYRIGVKAEPEGVGSDYLHHHLKPGDQLDISAPRGVFTLSPGARPLILMGAGIGITPLLAMLYFMAAGEKDREVWWVYTTQDRRHYPFQTEVRRVSASLANFHQHIRFTRPTPEDVPGEDYDATGRPATEALRRLSLPADADYYLCGPPGFMLDINTALRTLEVGESAIKQEVFGTPLATGGKSAPHLPAGSPGDGPLISFAKSGISFHWHPRWTSLLEAAEAADVPANWSCRVGVCHRCETTAFSGDVEYTSPPLDMPAAGNILLCCSIPRTDIQLDC
jgi:ferredoxin-NADP reductase